MRKDQVFWGARDGEFQIMDLGYEFNVGHTIWIWSKSEKKKKLFLAIKRKIYSPETIRNLEPTLGVGPSQIFEKGPYVIWHHVTHGGFDVSVSLWGYIFISCDKQASWLYSFL